MNLLLLAGIHTILRLTLQFRQIILEKLKKRVISIIIVYAICISMQNAYSFIEVFD